MKSLTSLLLLSAGILFGSLASASATTYTYSYSGSDGSFSFSDSSTPTPIFSTPGVSFILSESGLYNGMNVPFDVTFANKVLSGGFAAGSTGGTGLFFELGPQLYTGSEASPTFGIQKTPVGFFLNSGTFTVAASGNPVSAVPEPSTWAMMLLGLLGLGFLASCKTRKGRAASIAAA